MTGDGSPRLDTRRHERPPGSRRPATAARSLVSAASAALLEADGLRDLGERRLKDPSAPERIVQLGDGEFPPLKTSARRHSPRRGPAAQRTLEEIGAFTMPS